MVVNYCCEFCSCYCFFCCWLVVVIVGDDTPFLYKILLVKSGISFGSNNTFFATRFQNSALQIQIETNKRNKSFNSSSVKKNYERGHYGEKEL